MYDEVFKNQLKKIEDREKEIKNQKLENQK